MPSGFCSCLTGVRGVDGGVLFFSFRFGGMVLTYCRVAAPVLLSLKHDELCDFLFTTSIDAMPFTRCSNDFVERGLRHDRTYAALLYVHVHASSMYYLSKGSPYTARTVLSATPPLELTHHA